MNVGRGVHQGAVEIEHNGTAMFGQRIRLRVERVGEIAKVAIGRTGPLAPWRRPPAWPPLYA
jgi:hypothetical protein